MKIIVTVGMMAIFLAACANDQRKDAGSEASKTDNQQIKAVVSDIFPDAQWRKEAVLEQVYNQYVNIEFENSPIAKRQWFHDHYEKFNQYKRRSRDPLATDDEKKIYRELIEQSEQMLKDWEMCCTNVEVFKAKYHKVEFVIKVVGWAYLARMAINSTNIEQWDKYRFALSDFQIGGLSSLEYKWADLRKIIVDKYRTLKTENWPVGYDGYIK